MALYKYAYCSYYYYYFTARQQEACRLKLYMVSKVYDFSDDRISELAKVARNETAFPLWRATESR